MDETTVIQILSKIDDAKIIYIPGMIPHTMFRKLNNMVKNHWQNKSLLIGDVFKLLAGGEALEIIKQINAVYRNNGDVKVTKKSLYLLLQSTLFILCLDLIKISMKKVL